MTSTIIIAFCSLLLIAYVFDLTSANTKIPSVILLLLLGWLIRQMTVFLPFELPDLSSILPVFGTIGLILIVLEGALELELDKSKIGLVVKSFLGALIPLLVLAFIFTTMFRHFGGYSFRDSLINAIPLCVISSAIAIPSVKGFTTYNKEFVIYESSFSDIIGVIFFNFIINNESYGANTFLHFGGQLILIVIISFLATMGLSYLLHKIDHHIKFIPIILLVILIYIISKEFHLPSLVFILFFGLFIGNLDRFKHFKWIEKFRIDELKKESQKFKEITSEGAFLVRSLFFLLFGYLLETKEILNSETIMWSAIIVILIFVVRFLQLKVSNFPLKPLLFIAPRGLITILLFLSIEPIHNIALVNNSLIVQVIILTALIMMLGLLTRTIKSK